MISKTKKNQVQLPYHLKESTSFSFQKLKPVAYAAVNNIHVYGALSKVRDFLRLDVPVHQVPPVIIHKSRN